jgi:hypothetical protein
MKIANYPSSSPVTLSSKVIGTNVSSSNETENFVLSDIQTLFQNNIGTLQAVLNEGNTATQSINLTGSISLTGNIVGVGDLQRANGEFSGDVEIQGTIIDSFNSGGVSGAKLVSTGGGIKWTGIEYFFALNTATVGGLGIEDLTYDQVPDASPNIILDPMDNATIEFVVPGIYSLDLMINVYNDDVVNGNYFRLWIEKNNALVAYSKFENTYASDAKSQLFNYSWLLRIVNPSEKIKIKWYSSSTNLYLYSKSGVPSIEPNGASVALKITQV